MCTHIRKIAEHQLWYSAKFLRLPNGRRDSRIKMQKIQEFKEQASLLRGEPRGCTVVVVGIVNVVRVELELVVVPVEVGSVREHAVSLWIIVLVHPCHRNWKVVSVGNKILSHF